MTAPRWTLLLLVLCLAAHSPAEAAGQEAPAPAPGAPADSDPLWSLRQDADQGVADAQYRLGLKYRMGDGVPKDAAEAFRWYRMAAEKGHADAQTDLGWLFVNPEGGVRRDYLEAMNWFRRAAAQGHVSGQLSIGHLHTYGYGVPKNPALGATWTRLAAEQGDNHAMRVLAVMYWEGDGVLRDLVESGAWLRRAVLHNDREKDKEARLKALDARPEAGMTPEMVEEAKARARSWRPKSKEEVAGELASLLESTAPARDRPDPRTVTAPPEQLVAECVARINGRLRESQGLFPELSGIEGASVNSTSLEYTSGTVSWPQGERGGPTFGSPDSWQLRISLVFPGHVDFLRPWVEQRLISADPPLKADILFVCVSKNAYALGKTIGSIVDEEAGWLAVYLQVARDRPPAPAPGR